MVERKAFLANPKHQYRVSQRGEHDCSAITKRMEIIMGIQVCLISQMNVNFGKMVERNAFLANPKRQYRVFKCREQDCSAHNEENEDYNEYPSLSHFTDKH